MDETNNCPAGGNSPRDERAEDYFTWKGGRTSVDFKGYIKNVRGVVKLSHSGILKDAAIADSLARSNPFIRKDLEAMEVELRELGLLPPKDRMQDSLEARPSTEDKMFGKSTRSLRDKRRIDELEQELAQVKLERNDAREAIRRYNMLEQYMSETMRLPR